MRASEYGHVDIVKVLLENNSQVYLQDNEGRSSLMLASAKGHVDVVKVLLDYNAQIRFY